MEIKKVLVTGSEGYIGCVLVNKLVVDNFNVVGLDTCYFGEKNSKKYPNYKLIKEDIRNIPKINMKEIDAVIHLAALSNDPMGQLNPILTSEINYKSTINLARKAKESGVKKFIFSSSCSIYGSTQSSLVNEKNPVNPLTEYAKSKIKAENELSKLSDNSFKVHLLRNSTVYGYSPNFRCDLVVNDLTLTAFVSGEMRVISDGTPWRPLIDVRDLSDIFILFLKDNREIPPIPINVGFKENNLQVKEIVEKISRIFPKSKPIFLNKTTNDKRSYRVDFNKFNNLFPNIKQKWSIEKSVVDMVKNFKKLNNNDFNSLQELNRLYCLKNLMTRNILSNSLYWKI